MRYLTMHFCMFLLAYFFIKPTSGISQGAIDIICDRTQRPNVCKSLFNSDSRTTSATPAQLSSISISFMLNLANDGASIFTNIMKNNPDELFQIAAKKCLKYYNDIILKCKHAFNLSEKKLYTKITQFTESEKLASMCEDQIPTRSSMFDEVNLSMARRCEIAKSVNRYLIGG
ncbi:hypothetical protein ACFE04_009802 [Oxalis oulophora]